MVFLLLCRNGSDSLASGLPVKVWACALEILAGCWKLREVQVQLFTGPLACLLGCRGLTWFCSSCALVHPELAFWLDSDTVLYLYVTIPKAIPAPSISPFRVLHQAL